MSNGRCVQVVPSQVLLQPFQGNTGLKKNTMHHKNKTSNDEPKHGEDCDCHQPWLWKETVDLPGFLPIICHLPLDPPDPNYRLGLTSTLGASPSFWTEIN